MSNDHVEAKAEREADLLRFLLEVLLELTKPQHNLRTKGTRFSEQDKQRRT